LIYLSYIIKAIVSSFVTEDCIGNCISGVAIIRGDDVGVDVHGQAGGGVAEAMLDGLDVGAIANENRRLRVVKLVEGVAVVAAALDVTGFAGISAVLLVFEIARADVGEEVAAPAGEVVGVADSPQLAGINGCKISSRMKYAKILH